MKKRTVTFFDLKLSATGLSRAKGNEANFVCAPKSMESIIGLLKAAITKDRNPYIKSVKKKNKIAEQIYIKDFGDNSDYYVILINKSDFQIPDIVYSKPAEDIYIRSAKPIDHGGDFSSHVLISKKPIKGDSYYRCMIESSYGSGLSNSVIASYLNNALAKVRKDYNKEFLIDNSSGVKGKDNKILKVRWIHKIELQGLPSNSFVTDLSAGTLLDVDLISYDITQGNWDSTGFIKEDSRTLKLQVNKDAISNPYRAVKEVIGKAKSSKIYSEMRIRFNSQGTIKTVNMQVENETMINEEKYVKRHFINIDSLSVTSFDSIQKSIVTKMISLL